MITEIKDIIRKHNLRLTVQEYMNNRAVVVTDWDYWYHVVKYEESDLKKFKELPEYMRYKEINAGVGGSTVLTRK